LEDGADLADVDLAEAGEAATAEPEAAPAAQ
jgi:hypothetical protein